MPQLSQIDSLLIHPLLLQHLPVHRLTSFTYTYIALPRRRKESLLGSCNNFIPCCENMMSRRKKRERERDGYGM
jgi:hypothetical protein